MKKILFTIIAALIILAILGIALFYFLPVPSAVKDVATSTSIERCIYPIGVGYYSVNNNPGAVNTFYNREGERMCATGGRGVVYSEPEGPCKTKMCFSVYGN